MVSFTKLSTALLAFTSTSVSGFSINYGFPGGQDTKPIPGESPLQLCDATTSQLLNLKQVNLSPNPPVRGENLTVSATGLLKQDIEEGAYVDVDVTYGYIKLIHQTYNLCEELPNIDMECPIDAGFYSLEKQVEIPNEVPPGKYTVQARAYTKDDVLITCLTGVVEFPAYGATSLIEMVFGI